MVDEPEVLEFNPDTQSVTRVPPEQALGEEVGRVTTVLEVRRHKKLLLFVVTGELSPGELYRRLAGPFDRLGFDLHVAVQPGARVLVARSQAGERLWVNWVLLGATVFTTTLAGAALSGVDPLREPRLLWLGLPFSMALLFVLGIHELGHYAVARGWGMKTTLPFFIPVPPPFLLGTFGAFIRHRGPIPGRRALFDVGVSGPLIGLAAAVIVSAIGLSLPYEAPAGLQEALRRGERLPGLGLPPLFEWLVVATGFQGTVIHPVAFAGWVGMLVTVFNLLPAGQLDGGHVVRAVLGRRRAEALSRAVPLVLMGVGVLSSALGRPGGMWMTWGLFVFLFSLGGHPPPLDDVERLDRGRLAVALGTLVLAALSMTPVPFSIE
ncbi:MAG: site-2 protease family protein [Euryarchaeota archaeon]|nr:site-2 protease family protein [Euryarchaeota archaeon]